MKQQQKQSVIDQLCQPDPTPIVTGSCPWSSRSGPSPSTHKCEAGQRRLEAAHIKDAGANNKDTAKALRNSPLEQGPTLIVTGSCPWSSRPEPSPSTHKCEAGQGRVEAAHVKDIGANSK